MGMISIRLPLILVMKGSGKLSILLQDPVVMSSEKKKFKVLSSKPKTINGSSKRARIRARAKKLLPAPIDPSSKMTSPPETWGAKALARFAVSSWEDKSMEIEHEHIARL